MISAVKDHLPDVRAACRRHSVARLEVFGSAADPAAFDAAKSDVDFIVRFLPGAELGPWLAEYFNLRDELQSVLGRPVELVMESAMRDPLFLREANRTRQLLYAAKDLEAA